MSYFIDLYGLHCLPSSHVFSRFFSRLYGLNQRVLKLCLLFGVLILRAPIMTAADDIHKYFSLFFRENKT